jgi:nicotinamide phosphoribosyltransferase
METNMVNDHINIDNLMLSTDSYKLNHWQQYPKNTQAVYSYFESREGSEFPYTVFYGLQYILKRYLEGVVVTQEDLEEAAELAEAHFGNASYFNRAGWQHIIDEHGGKLPLRILAVPEGTVVPTGNVLMTVESTDEKCFWLTNLVESKLTHVWYSSNVATLSRVTKEDLAAALDIAADSRAGLEFMLHDFGYRGATSHESAAIGGSGHLLNFLGTDTLPAMQIARKFYDAPLEGLAYSVAATEHSIMTALGPDGEIGILDELLNDYPTGILSVVSDSYNIYEFVDEVVKRAERIKARDGVFVVRPDSVDKHGPHPSPALLTVELVKRLWDGFGGTTNGKGFKVLDPHVRVLWGDGIDRAGIRAILQVLMLEGFSPENMVFGMGGGLLQKHNRDTQRFAFKSSAQRRDNVWHDVFKKPVDLSKASKRGRLALIEYEGHLQTLSDPYHEGNLLELVFENGEVKNNFTFAEARANAELKVPVTA